MADKEIKNAVPGQEAATDTGVTGDTSVTPASTDHKRGDLDNKNAVLEGADADKKDDGKDVELDSNGEEIKETKTPDFKKGFDATLKAKRDAKKKLNSSYREEDQPPVVDVPGSAPSAAGAPDAKSTIKTKTVSEELAGIFTGQDLSEDFQSKAKTLFEAVITERVNAEVAIVQEAADEAMAKFTTELTESLQSQVDKYLDYVVKEWLEENRLAVETGLKTEIAEDFMVGLKALFAEHNINIPADEENVLEETIKEKAELESKVNSMLEDNAALQEQIVAFQKKEILATVSEGLADSQREKLTSLAESVEFKDEKTYREQVSHIKEHYFPKTKVVTEEVVLDGVDVQKDVKVVPAHIAEAAKYISANAQR